MEWKLNRVRDSWTYIRNALGLPRSPERHILYHFVCSVSCTVVIGTPLLYQGAAASDRTCNKAKGGDAPSSCTAANLRNPDRWIDGTGEEQRCRVRPAQVRPRTCHCLGRRMYGGRSGWMRHATARRVRRAVRDDGDPRPRESRVLVLVLGGGG